MSSPESLHALVRRVASRALKGHTVSRILIEPASDSAGGDALHITVVTGDDRGLGGDLALDTLVDIDRAMREAGEHRTAIVSFADGRELDSNVDPEPGASPRAG